MNLSVVRWLLGTMMGAEQSTPVNVAPTGTKIIVCCMYTPAQAPLKQCWATELGYAQATG